MVESDGGDLEGSIVPDIAIEGVLYDVKTVAATTEHYAPGHIEACSVLQPRCLMWY